MGKKLTGWLTLAVLVATTVGLGLTLWRLAGEGRPLSAVDEYVHADTAFKVHQGGYPARGSVLEQEVADTWHCHTGHTIITWDVPCGSPDSRPAGVPAPTGKYTTGYIHYPTYFVLGEGWRRAHDVAADPAEFSIDTYRRFAALMMTLGVAAGAAVAWKLGLRGGSLLAAAFAPVAASSILVYGTMVNPMSLAPLCGVLIAGTGIRWMVTGRGFWWLAAAVGFGASVAVTSSLPGGVFLLACLIALLLRWRGRTFDSPWQPRWWQAAVLSAVLLAPIVAFGVFIEARASMDDATLYAHYQLAEWSQVWFGVWAEIFVPHLPWVDDGSMMRTELSKARDYARAAGIGLPFLVTYVVAGTLVAGASGALRRHDPQPVASPEKPDQEEHTDRAPVRVMTLLATSSLLGVLIYPPLLRLLNAINMGIDYAIVSRYSISLTPLFVLVVLMLGRDHPWFGRILGGIATASVLAVCITAW